MTATESTGTTASDLLDRLTAIVPSLRQRAPETEELRRVPEATMREALDSGFLGAFRPRRYGGSGLGLSALANGARTLAHGCASSAWTLVFLAQHVWRLGKFPDSLQDELMGGGTIPLIAADIVSVGTATRTDGGYLVSGRTQWNSAIAHSSWASMKARVEDAIYVFYLQVDDVKVDDRWHTSGMRGTSSESFMACDIFVPTVRAVPLQVTLEGDQPGLHPDEPFRDYPPILVGAITCSAVIVGAAEAAVDLFQEQIRDRILTMSGGLRQVDQPFAQMRLGEVVTKVRMARALWDACIRQLDDSYGRGEGLSVADRAGLRSSCALVAHTCRDVVNAIMTSAGATSYFLSMPLQRMQRDVEMMKSHVMFDWDRVAELQGRVTLGIPLAPTDMV